MAEYSVQIATLGGSAIDEVPARGLSYGDILNAPGGCEFHLPLRDPKCTKTLLAPGQREIWVLRDKTRVWGGYLWSARPEGDKVAFAGQGFFSRLRRQLIDATRVYTATDQLDIAWDLVEFIQSQPGGDFGITRGSTTLSGITRDRTYFDYELKNLGDAITELAGVERGFDFAISPERVWTTYYPQRGTVASNVVFELGKNIQTWSAPEDAFDVCSRIVAAGAGDGAAMLRSSQTDATALGEYGLLADTRSFRDVSVPATLDEHAREELRLAKVARFAPELTVTVADPPYGAFGVGDSVHVRLDAGYVDVDRMMRIGSLTVRRSDEGQELVELGFEEELSA